MVYKHSMPRYINFCYKLTGSLIVDIVDLLAALDTFGAMDGLTGFGTLGHFLIKVLGPDLLLLTGLVSILNGAISSISSSSNKASNSSGSIPQYIFIASAELTVFCE